MVRKRTHEDTDVEDTLDKHDTVFLDPICLFRRAPINETFIEHREEVVHATPASSPFAETYTFKSAKQTSGLIKVNFVKIEANLQFHHANGDALVPFQDIVFKIPSPLQNMWRTKSLKINGTLLNAESNHEGQLSYLMQRLTQNPKISEQSEDIDGKIFDLAGHFEHNGGATNANAPWAIGVGYHADVIDGHDSVLSLAARKRHRLLSGVAPVYLMDRPAIPLFDNNGEDRYLPSSFEIDIKLVRRPMNDLVMGSQLPDNAANAIAAQKLAVRDFKMIMPIFKPKEQLRVALNKKFISDKAEAIYYTTEWRTVTCPLAVGATSFQKIDIFNGSLPTRVFMVLVNTTAFSGSFTLNPHNYRWFDMNNISLSLNSTLVKPILENTKQAYTQLMEVLNRKYDEMPFTFKNFENGNCINGWDLSPNKDSHQQVLPIVTTGNLSIDIRFANAIPAPGVTAIFFGDHRNEFQIGFETEGRKYITY